jgi:hypothetical protein
LFCDLVSSTERRARLGDDAYDEFNRQLFVVLRNSISAFGGREVSNAGDGMMIVFPESVVDAVMCASEMHAEAAHLDVSDPPQLRIGISCGEVAQDGDNYSGMPIVEAARLESQAAPGQTLANAVVRTLVGTRRALRFRDLGPLALKGIPEPLATVEVIGTSVVTTPPTTTPAPASRAPRKRARLWVGAIILAVVIVAGVVIATRSNNHSSTAASAPRLPTSYHVSYTSSPCPPEAANRIRGLTCATLTVPENRKKPAGPVVKLNVYRAPARGKATSDPVLDFGADDLASSPARANRDEILLAQRGYGGGGEFPSSDPALGCPEYSRIAGDALAKPAGDEAEKEREVAAFRGCYKRLTRSGIDPSQYNYLAMGDDMVDLIRALHLKHVNLVSGYVATISALEVTRVMPDVVRSITLQEAVPGGRSASTDPTRYLSNAFNSYVALCRADQACRASFPDLAGDLRRDYDTYRTHPRVVPGDDGNGHKHEVLIDGPRVAQAIAGALFDTSDYPLLAAGIHAPDRTAAIDSLVAGRIMVYNAFNVDSHTSWGASLSNECSYDKYTVDAGHSLSSSTSPELSGVDDGFLTTMCQAWPVRKLPDIAFDDPNTSTPIFDVSGGLAPGNDQAWPNAFESSLPNATVATLPTLGAQVLNTNNPRCLADLRRQFLDDPNSRLAVDACVAQSPPIKFATSTGP